MVRVISNQRGRETFVWTHDRCATASNRTFSYDSRAFKMQRILMTDNLMTDNLMRNSWLTARYSPISTDRMNAPMVALQACCTESTAPSC